MRFLSGLQRDDHEGFVTDSGYLLKKGDVQYILAWLSNILKKLPDRRVQLLKYLVRNI